MKRLFTLSIFSVILLGASAQTPFERVYTTLNQKCQNGSCHSATSTSDGPKFDGSSSQVYSSIFDQASTLYPSSVNKYEKLVKPQHPYTSFLLRKIAGEQFDTDLAIDTTTEGHRMLDINQQPLTKIEIEFIRQWIRFGAKQTYGNNDPQPDYTTIAKYYNDGELIAPLPKPVKPNAGEGMQLRMGPVFLPVTGTYIEQEWLEQQEVNFPYQAEVYEIDGFMNQQSHHFLLFKFEDSTAARSTTPSGSLNRAASDIDNLGQVTPAGSNFITSFDGSKFLTGAWQDDENMLLPQGTALMWDKKTWLDMNFHTKNYNATSVLPCDFYFNIYYRPRSSTTIPMLSKLVNNAFLGQYAPSCHTGLLPYALPNGTSYTQSFTEPDAADSTGTRYLWMATGHTHKYGTAFYLRVKNSNGQLGDTIYDGSYNYALNLEGTWDHSHPGVEYWPNLLPVHYGSGAGTVAVTTWLAQESCVGFGFTTSNEMQLYYYMYTKELPSALGVKSVGQKSIYFEVMPNPMNSNGKLVYELEKDATVEASIVDISGKMIASLENEKEQAGTHEVTLGNSQQLSAGIYFARLVIDGSVYNKKFIVTE